LRATDPRLQLGLLRDQTVSDFIFVDHRATLYPSEWGFHNRLDSDCGGVPKLAGPLYKDKSLTRTHDPRTRLSAEPAISRHATEEVENELSD
jgi:hypothetical protein